MIELFARRPNAVLLPDDIELAPISVEEDVISLSAILMDGNYFEALKNLRLTVDGISIVDQRILIPFKARAFLDLAGRKANGEAVDSRHIRKHRGDVFRLIQLLPATGSLTLTDPLRADLTAFLEQVAADQTFDYRSLGLSITHADAKAALNRYYRLGDHA